MTTVSVKKNVSEKLIHCAKLYWIHYQLMTVSHSKLLPHKYPNSLPNKRLA